MKRNVDVVRAFVAIVSAALFSVIFAVLASSCTENSAPDKVPVEKTAKLQLVVMGTSLAPQSRAEGAGFPTTAEEAKINTLVVGVFNADGTVNSISQFEPTSNAEVAEMDCAPGTCDIIVVANAPKGTFEGVQTKAEYLSKTVDLSQTASGNVQTANNLPMSGQVTATLVANAETPVSVNLTRLVARISVDKIATAFTGEDVKNATFKLDKIFLCNALSSSKIAPGDVATTFPGTPQWLNEDSQIKDEATTGISASYLMNEITPVTLSGDGVNEYTYPNWFYAFANNDEQHRTKLVISGWFDIDGAVGSIAPVYVYYPIVVNQAQLGTDFTGSGKDETHNGTISRNRDYRVRAKIAKKGVSSPSEDIGIAELQLTVAVDDWKLEIIQDVTIE
ncbi:fimbrial protein [Bacteroides sp.]